ncbi:hypothetical protein DFH09DRAFT_1316743 [Mycena vulgaris]|nr:hypothetical protein DFH09DRAFT_1316743 [Mycena vulgaris]
MLAVDRECEPSVFIHLSAERLRSSSGTISAIHRLSTEILALIFLFCRDEAISKPGADYATSDPQYPPVLLGQVCTRWRTIAHGTPRLWDFLSLSKSAFTRDGGVHVQQLLEQSKNLTLCVVLESTSASEAPRRNHRIFDAVWDASRRVQSLVMDVSSVDATRHLFPRKITFPVLASLELTIGPDPRDYVDLSAILEAFARLRAALVRRQDPQRREQPHARITILPNLSNLEIITFSLTFEVWSPVGVNLNPADLSALLCALPALQTLDVRWEGSPGNALFQILTSDKRTFQATLPQLTTLTLSPLTPDLNWKSWRTWWNRWLPARRGVRRRSPHSAS